jgi:hypothetical protein
MENYKIMPPIKTTIKESAPLTEQFFGQVSESIQLVFDLTSRIDERVKMIIERQKEIDDQIDKLIEMQNSALQRLAAVETVLQSRDIENRLQILSEKVSDTASDQELESLKESMHSMQIKMENISLRLGNNDGRWFIIFDGAWKVAYMIIAGYILYKLGIKN